ncbi:peptidylprolyl isomerase [Pseudoruegeria sp. SK021]|uniref:peptidylprolyl isomerase n=1 Tax=Pseudoruegeria sp. SK021 TaxID=1933035 RepID=UPI000A21648F|nr:peptidylprolyl isomerase [Pseudoruegeria sp. SK021]OSP56256.1 hypothetical protein BV911_02910 [Pseudoruegeria sp. SK021]
MAGKPKSMLTNILVWMVLAMLIVGLAGFGVGNFGGTVTAVAAVGKTEVPITSYGRALQQQMATITQQTGETANLAQMQAAGVDQGVLSELLAAAALDEAARKIGLSVGDDAVSQEILTIPAFQGVNGSFDRDAYSFALDQSGFTVSQFENQIRQEVARSLFQSALIAGIAPSATYSDTIYKFIGEQRDFTYAQMTAADLDAPVAAPDAEAVQAFYDANPDLFRLPESKAITYVWLTPDMLVDEIEVDETALRTAYQERIDEFVRPEQRMVQRLGFADMAAAEAAKEQLDSGETTFADLLDARGLTEDDVDLGVVTESDLDAAGAGVFALTDTGVTGALPSPIGPALFQVNAILSPQETSFEDAVSILREDMAYLAARARISEDVEALDDLLAGGATLEDLNAESEVEIGSLNWIGEPGDGITAYNEFQSAAASVTADDYPSITVLDDGSIFALRLDDVIPSALPPMDDVRELATDLAQDAAIRAALSETAADYIVQLDNGASFMDLNLTPSSETGLTRRDLLRDLPVSIMEQAFDLAPGKATIVEGTDDVYLLRLDAVAAPDPNDPTAEFLRTSLNQQAAQSMAQDIQIQIARAVQAEEGISINQAAINAVHAQLP